MDVKSFMTLGPEQKRCPLCHPIDSVDIWAQYYKTFLPVNYGSL
jgi:hypothetical protein